MRYERTDAERRSDNALLLTLWAQAQRRSSEPDEQLRTAGDKLKLMKLAFLATYRLCQDNVKALNLQFFRWKKGPMAREVYTCIEDLTYGGMLLEEEEFTVSEEGFRLADSFALEVLGLPQNKHARRVLESVAEDFGPLDTQSVLAKVYGMRCYLPRASGLHLVRAIKQSEQMTEILDEADAESCLVIPPGWQATLDLALSHAALRNLERGVDDIRAGHVYSWEQMWQDV